MRLNRLDLNLLVALDALLSERSITRAAERIHLSQPATSGALSRLREFFDDELLVRVGAQMMPTPLGESLAAPVHNILLQIQTTVERRVEFNASESDRCFRILASDYMSSTVLAPLVQRVAKLAPGIQFEFFMPSNDPKDKLEQGDIDFLLMPQFVMSEHHPSRVLLEEEFVCVAWSENAHIDEQISLKQYLDLGQVSVRFGSQRTESQDQIYTRERLGLQPKIEVVASTFNAIPQLVVGTQRIATVYRKLAEMWSNYLPLKILPLPVDIPSIAFAIQWHKLRELDPSMQWLIKQVQAVVKAEKENSLESKK